MFNGDRGDPQASISRRRLLTGAAGLGAAAALTSCAREVAAAGEPGHNFRVGYYMSDQHPFASDGILKFVEDVEAASDRAVSFELFPSGQLGGADEALRMLDSGIVDLVCVIMNYFPSELSLNQAWNLPIQMNEWSAGQAFWEVIHGQNDFTAELAGLDIVPIVAASTPASEIATSTEPITGFGDLEGLRMRVGTNIEEALAGDLGMGTVFTSSGEIYESIRNGTVDGALYHLAGWPSFQLQEIIGHCTANTENVVTPGVSLCMKGSRWTALAPDIQELFLESARHASAAAQAAYSSMATEVHTRDAVEAGVVFHEWSATDLELLHTVHGEVVEDWVSAAERIGLPAGSAVETLRSAVSNVTREPVESFPRVSGFPWLAGEGSSR